jgi:hypothetical protein
MKKLQEDSKFNDFDVDGDGIVTDEELARSERMLQIENNDKMQDQQRLMAWVAMLSTIIAVFALLSPFIAIERMNAASGLLKYIPCRTNRNCGRLHGRDGLGQA